MSENNKPTHRAFVITGKEDEKKNWKEIGAAWPNKDGKGFNINLHANPIDGKIVLRQIDAKDDAAD